jgi:membrane protein YdbS with pleckstrin-like domain
VDQRAVTWWTLSALMGWGIFLLVCGGVLLGLWSASVPIPLVVWIASGVLVLWALVDVLVVPHIRYRVHRWEVTDEAVYTLSGWWSRRWRIAPISRIQTVDTARGLLQQLVGLSTVTVTTASSAGALSIEGLDRAAAEELAQRLTAVTHATPGDAT